MKKVAIILITFNIWSPIFCSQKQITKLKKESQHTSENTKKIENIIKKKFKKSELNQYGSNFFYINQTKNKNGIINSYKITSPKNKQKKENI